MNNIKKEGIEYDQGVDEVEPSLDTPIKENIDIKLLKLETKRCRETKAIHFETITEE